MTTRMFVFLRLELLICLMGLALLCGCPPDSRLQTEGEPDPEGKFIATSNKLYDRDSPFDIRWEVEYPANEAGFDTALNVSNRQLALNRCTWCHECGFKKAFDFARYGTMQWRPRYIGQQWSDPVDRMSRDDATMLNEQVATRIYTFLRDETLGLYDESKDEKGAIVVETKPSATPQVEPSPG
jgi:hypothetical protein